MKFIGSDISLDVPVLLPQFAHYTILVILSPLRLVYDPRYLRTPTIVGTYISASPLESTCISLDVLILFPQFAHNTVLMILSLSRLA